MRAVVLLASLALMACQPEVPPPAKEMPSGDCGAEGMQSLIGQDKSVLAAMTFPAGTRIIEPGQPVTMDYNPSRLNISLDRAGLITRVSCG